MILPIKIKQAIKQFLHRNKTFNNILNVDSLKKIRKSIDVKDPYLPLSGNYRLDTFDKIDINKFNAEMDMLTVDARTISNTIDNLIEEIKNKILFNEVQKIAFKNKQQQIIKDGVFLISGQFIEGFTTNINFKKDFKNEDNQLEVESHYIKLKTTDENIIKNNYTNESVSITVDKYLGQLGENFEPEIIGSKSWIVDKNFGNNLSILVKSVIVETITIKIRINLNIKNVNTLNVFFPEPNFGQFINITINTLGNKNKEIYSNLNKSDRITTSFETTDIKYAIISISQKLPNYTVAGVNIYKFDISKVKVSNTNRQLTGTITTRALPIKEDTSFLSFVVEETLVPDSSIEYLASYDINEEGKPVNFFNIIPVNRPGQNLESNFVKIGTRKYIQIVEHNTQSDINDWSNLITDKTYGGKLYSIFDLSKVEEIQDLQLDETTAKLYRGIDDWSITRKKITNQTKYEKVYYLPNYNSLEKTYIKEDINITSEDEFILNENSIVGSSLKIELNYMPIPTLDWIFKDQNFNQVEFEITNWGTGTKNSNNKYEIFISNIDPSRYGKYTFRYYFKLKEITNKKISIDKLNTILYGTDGKLLNQGLDYVIIDETKEKKIEFLRNGNYRGQNLLMDVIVNDESLQEYSIFKCIVDVSSNININIGAFNRREIDAGNFHKINGEDVSLKTSYNFTIGTYIIETTQPYPGYNQFTQENTNAFIDIPTELVNMRGYEESLRKVPIYELALNSGNDDRQFSIADNKIYLNRKPDYLTSINERSEGKYMKCLKIRRNGDLEHIPEKFKFEITYKDETVPKIIYLSVKLQRSPDNINTPVVEKIGFNEFNTEIF